MNQRIYRNWNTKKTIDVKGALSSVLLNIAYPLKPTFEIVYVKVTSNSGASDTVTPIDLSGYIFRAAMDTDFNDETDVMSRSSYDMVDVSEGVNGIIKVKNNSDNNRFYSQVNGQKGGQRQVTFQIYGCRPGEDEDWFDSFPVMAIMPVDPYGATKPPPNQQTVWASQSWVESRIRAGREIQFSVDGENDWHDEQAENVDMYWRERYPNGEWSTAIKMVAGQKGDKGDTGDAFTYEDFTPEELALLKGDKGDKGDTGDAFTYEDFTPEELALLKGEKGDKGDIGPAFHVDESGLLSGKSTYDDEPAGFAYLATDTGNLYIKNSATSADWSDPVPFKGDKGDTGDAFTYEDFTPEELALLKGEKGDKGDTGDTPDFISGTFSSSDLTDGILTITHSQGNVILPLIIVDNNGKNISLDSAAVTFSNNSITIDLSAKGVLTGTWKYTFGGIPAPIPDFISGTFTNSDLTEGILTVTHSNGNVTLPYAISDNTGKNIVLDSTAVTFAENEITIDFTAFGTLTGAWKYAFGGLPGEPGADGINLVLHLSYNPATNYRLTETQRDAVSDSGNIYATVQDNNQGHALTDESWWKKVISKGDQGDPANPIELDNVTYTDDHILASGDLGKRVRMDKSTSITLTIESGLSVKAAAAIFKVGAGNVTVQADEDIYLNNVLGGSCTIIERYRGAMVNQVSEDHYEIFGSNSEVS